MARCRYDQERFTNLTARIAWSLDGFNRREFEAVAGTAGVKPFRPGENVPDWKQG